MAVPAGPRRISVIWPSILRLDGQGGAIIGPFPGRMPTMQAFTLVLVAPLEDGAFSAVYADKNGERGTDGSR